MPSRCSSIKAFNRDFTNIADGRSTRPNRPSATRSLEIALGPIIYKTDPQLVHLGYQGTDAYARDENGNFIVEAFGPGNPKMQLIWLEMVRPEVWGKRRKRKIARTGGVLVLGERPK
jgi:hypothetical protein